MASYDYIIKNGTIIDPKTNLRTVANVGISKNKIAAITRAELQGTVIIDAQDKIVCPGFIDPHCHIDGYIYSAQCHARMGVTTAITGNCGFGPENIGEFLAQIDADGFPINQGVMVGHSFNLREMVGLTDPFEPASDRQIQKMVKIADIGLQEGALGISMGLQYAPAIDMKEILPLAKLAAKYDKVMPIHSRNDGWDSIKALKEMIKIQRMTGVRILISHLTYQNGMGMMQESIKVIEKAIQEGYQIAVDSGAYEAFATYIGSEVFGEGWLEKYDCTYNAAMISSGPHTGKRLTKELYNTLRQEEPNTLCTAFVGKFHETIEALQQPYVMISTDGAIGSHQPNTGHPQDAGTYPRVLGKFVREMNALTMMEAIKKATLMPAEFLGLPEKGWIGIGADADIVVFDPEAIIDTSNYIGIGIPDSSPIGIEYVFVNGIPVIENAKLNTAVKPGKAIRKNNCIWELS